MRCAALPAAMTLNVAVADSGCASSARCRSARASHARMAAETMACRSPWRRLMIILGVGPGRQAGHDVEFAQEAGNHRIGIVADAEMVELAQHAADGAVGIGDGALGVVLALLRQALAVFEKLLTIEVGQNQTARNPNRADKACHATPRLGHMLTDGSSLRRVRETCQTNVTQLSGRRGRLRNRRGSRAPS